MYNHRKTFSKELFDKHDQFAKTACQSLLKQMDFEIVDETEAYGSHDFIVRKKGQDIKVEVEQKMGWKHDAFPFSTHDVSCRKKTSNAEMFFQVNARGTAVMLCPMSVVTRSPIVKKNTKFGTIDEPFFAVPVSMVRYFFLQDGVWYEEFDA